MLVATPTKPNNSVPVEVVEATVVDPSSTACRRRIFNEPNIDHTSIRIGNYESPTRQGKKRLRRKRSKDYHDNDEPPFYVLVLQVGATLALLVAVFFFVYRTVIPASPAAVVLDTDDADDGAFPISVRQMERLADGESLEEEMKEKPTSPPLPVWNLTDATKLYDAFGIASRYGPGEDTTDPDLSLFWQAAKGLRTDFADTYGGENAARALLDRGLVNFGRANGVDRLPTDLLTTACRIRQAQHEKRPFRFAFGGYSVTAGRGNYFRQAFPAVMEKLLHPVFYLLSIQLEVRNAAIGGIPSFPYGWCMSNFWHPQADVVSWDYAMNEAGGDPLGLEAYLRHTLQLPRRPKLIVKDTDMAVERHKLLQAYATQGLLPDPVVMQVEPAARPLLDRAEADRPRGFQDWRKFGSPPGAPGQALHHPAVKEHQLMAWMLTMHFLAALELVAADQTSENPILNCAALDQTQSKESTTSQPAALLPQPFIPEAANMTQAWSSILFGAKQTMNSDSTGDLTWKMNPVHCRTSFVPILSGDLSSIVVAGGVAQDMDLMLPKPMFYTKVSL